MGILLIVLKLLALAFVVVFCLVLVLLLSLVLIPFQLKTTLASDKEYEATIDIRWLWSILGVEFVFIPKKKFISLKLFSLKFFTSTLKPRPPEAKKEKALEKAKKKAKKKEKERKKKPSIEEQLEQVADTIETLSRKALEEVMIFLLSLFSSLKLKLSGELEIGLTDPAETGMLLGFFYAVSGAFSITNFRLYPNWEEPTFRGNVTLFGRVWLADIIRILAKFMFSSSIRRIWWPKVKERIKLPSRVRPQVIEQ